MTWQSWLVVFGAAFVIGFGGIVGGASLAQAQTLEPVQISRADDLPELPPLRVRVPSLAP
jgi:hypothetical protein